MAMQTLYVANIPAETDETALAEVFSKYGEVTSIELGTDERFELPYAIVTMSSEKAATKSLHNLNGH